VFELLKQTIRPEFLNRIDELVMFAPLNDPQFGARPVKRAIQKFVLNDLSKRLIGGTVHSDQTIVVDYDGERLVFRN